MHCQQLSLNHFFNEDMIHMNICDSMILWSSKDTFLKPEQIQQKLQYAVSFWGDTARGQWVKSLYMVLMSKPFKNTSVILVPVKDMSGHSSPAH